MKKLKEAKKLVCLRLDDNIKTTLETIAEKKDRSFSSLIRIILKNYIEQEKNLS